MSAQHMPEPWQPDLVIYHHPCRDGFAAAWACWKRWGDRPTYYGTNYGAPPPDASGQHVLIVDFSYRQGDLEAMMKGGALSIVILDHHKTAEADLAPFIVGLDGDQYLTANMVGWMLKDMADMCRPPILASFDMEHSGAALAWHFCHTEPAPDLINLVEDRDLWRFNFEATKPVNLMLQCIAQSFHAWDQVHLKGTMAAYNRGAAMQEYQDWLVATIAARADWVTLGEHRFMGVNCPYELSSEVAHCILNNHPETPFAGTWLDNGAGTTSWSLRSDDSRADVSAIARQFGGGGHRNAAGCKTALSKANGHG